MGVSAVSSSTGMFDRAEGEKEHEAGTRHEYFKTILIMYALWGLFQGLLACAM